MYIYTYNTHKHTHIYMCVCVHNKHLNYSIGYLNHNYEYIGHV